MIARPTYFEVQYDCPAGQLHTPVHIVCSHVREDILNGLAVVIRSRNYTCNTTPLIGIDHSAHPLHILLYVKERIHQQ